MAVTYLAAQNTAFQVGYLVLALGVPTVGWILLIVGLKQRSRGRPRPGAQLTDHPVSAPTGPSGTRLVIIGAALLAVGLSAILWRLATTGTEPTERSGSTESSARTEVRTPALPGLAAIGDLGSQCA